MQPDLRGLIISTANSLGISPLDLATAISYETAGTFDPMKKGPTTQWGQHEGLIQFGQPQQRQFGVDLSNPQAAVSSQLGPQGAVAKYLKATGVRPGMGMLDIYSAINAGGVGRYGASDANNGGAPGTVMDKVNNQMAGHRANAERLLGSDSGLPPAASILHPEIDPTPRADTLTSQPVFGSMSPGGPPASMVGWAHPELYGQTQTKKPTIGDRIAAAGQALDNSVMPAAQIDHPFGGDARQGMPDLMKLLGNPNAYAQALLQRRMA
jgi:hypothetical protein